MLSTPDVTRRVMTQNPSNLLESPEPIVLVGTDAEFDGFSPIASRQPSFANLASKERAEPEFGGCVRCSISWKRWLRFSIEALD